MKKRAESWWRNHIAPSIKPDQLSGENVSFQDIVSEDLINGTKDPLDLMPKNFRLQPHQA